MPVKKLPTVDMAAAQAEANVEAEEAKQYLAHIFDMEITTNDQLKWTVGITAEIKEKAALVDAKLRRFTDAARAIITEADALFKPAIKSLGECEKVLKNKMVEFDIRQAGRRDELLMEAGEVSTGKGDADLDKASALLSDADACIVEKVPGLSFRRSVKVDMLDPEAAVQWCVENNRLELLQLNEKAIKALVKSTSSPSSLKIPGVVVNRSSVAAITVGDVERAE